MQDIFRISMTFFYAILKANQVGIGIYWQEPLSKTNNYLIEG